MFLWTALLACSSGVSDISNVRPPPEKSLAPVRFVAVGDVGKAIPTQRSVATAIGKVCDQQGCDFGLLLGDNLYPSGMDSDDDPRMDSVFSEVYGPLNLEFKVVLGNHDYGWGQAERAERQLRYATRTKNFTLPSRFYRFQAGQADFFALDTDHVFFNGPSEQGAWLDNSLGQSSARWNVVFGHHPYRSNGDHGNAGTYEGHGWVPYLSGSSLYTLFSKHVAPSADLYLSGHEHNLQVMRHKGLPLIVSGSGASTTELVDRGNTPDLSYAVPGFVWVELADAITVAVYDEEGILLGQQIYPHPRE